MHCRLTSYPESSQTLVDQIFSAVRAKDSAGRYEAAHRLKSSSVQRGAMVLAAHCESTGNPRASGPRRCSRHPAGTTHTRPPDGHCVHDGRTENPQRTLICLPIPEDTGASPPESVQIPVPQALGRGSQPCFECGFHTSACLSTTPYIFSSSRHGRGLSPSYA